MATVKGKSSQVSSVIKSIEVEVPVRTAYDQWTQFEEFPRFMEGVEEVRQIDDANLHWRAEIGGQEVEWTARITEQIPDQRIAWTSTSGAPNAGVVTFHHLAPDRCRVTLQLDYEPETMTEKMGDWLGMVGRRTEGDLERFKEFIEERGAPTGAFRGEIRSRDSLNR
jgi:uncharacterized membrane protein